MKALMLPIVAFLVFFALGSGAGAYMTKPALADSTLVDSLHADSTHADSTHGDSAKADTSHGAATLTPNQSEPDSATLANDPHAADPVHSPTVPAASAAPAATRGPNSIASLARAQTGATVSMRPDGSIVGAPADSQPNYQRLASLLSKMGAREAARTVEQLPSIEAAHALAAMSDKQAALVLAQLQPDKAAALLQATLALIPRTVAP